jgi:hypothetical protein
MKFRMRPDGRGKWRDKALNFSAEVLRWLSLLQFFLTSFSGVVCLRRGRRPQRA